MSIAPFPHTYRVTLEDMTLREAPRPPIPAGSPPQFGGSADVWSPEDLLVASVLLCLKTTFDAYVLREGITVGDWRGTGTGVLVKGPGGPVFERIELEVELAVGPGEEARARALLEKAERQCIISRSVTAPVHLKSTVTEAPGLVAAANS